MSLTIAIILASLAVYSWKILGFSIPTRFLEEPRVSRIVTLLTVALLSALLGTQGLTTGQSVVLDERLPALAVAAVLLRFRAPYILVVAVAAGVAALLRILF
jgi:hypothetical protein